MPGSSADFAGDAMFRIVQATKVVIETLSEPPVVVGGLAVMCRLQTAHRATLDLDVVDRGLQAQAHLEVLRRIEGASDVDPSAVLLPTHGGEVKVDVLEVNQAEIDQPSDDPGDRLHATSHAWAYDTATEVGIMARNLGGETIEVVTFVSEPGPLVAMKLQAIMNRTNDKEGTDLLDIVQLILDRGCRLSAVTQIQRLSAQMKADMRQHSNLWFADKRGWSLGKIRSAGGDVGADDLELVHEILAEATSA